MRGPEPGVCVLPQVFVAMAAFKQVTRPLSFTRRLRIPRAAIGACGLLVRCAMCVVWSERARAGQASEPLLPFAILHVQNHPNVSRIVTQVCAPDPPRTPLSPSTPRSVARVCSPSPLESASSFHCEAAQPPPRSRVAQSA
eukprot:3557843-Rhodomonas_salina.2